MVIFVGDRPSSKNTDPTIAFVGTKSYDTLQKWIKELQIDEPVLMINRTDPNFSDHMRLAIIYDNPVITLGNNAERAVKKLALGVLTFQLPHPSGRNRILNDKDNLLKRLSNCKSFIINKNLRETYEDESK